MPKLHRAKRAEFNIFEQYKRPTKEKQGKRKDHPPGDYTQPYETIMNDPAASYKVLTAGNFCCQHYGNLSLAAIRIYKNLYNQESFIHRDEEERVKSSKALVFLFRFYNPKEVLTRRRRGSRVKNFEGKRTDALVNLLSVSESLRYLLD